MKIPEAGKKTAGKYLGTASLVIQESGRSLLKNNGFEMSAALASYGFFSLIPLLFFIMYLMGNYVISSETALRGVDGLATHMFPRLSDAIMSEIAFLTKQKDAWGIFSLIMLLVSIIPFMDTARTAFRGILKTGEKISFVRSQLQNVLALLVMLGLFVLLVVGEIIFSFLTADLVTEAPRLVAMMDVVASFVIVILLVVAFYRTLMPARMGNAHLLITSLIAASLLLATGGVFSRFLVMNPSYGIAFGSLKAIGIIIAWVYCSFLVLLFGAEIMVAMSKRDALLLKKLFLHGPLMAKRSKGLLDKFVEIHEAGNAICHEGEKAEAMYYILSGTVTINKGDRIIGRMGKGHYFGEMAALLDSPRTASVIAEEGPVVVVAISHDNLEIILREDPDVVMGILKEMALRLKRTSENVV
jgi:membrane protein